MQKQVLHTEVLGEREQTSRKVVLVMFLALVAWVIVALAQGVIYCGSILGGFKK